MLDVRQSNRQLVLFSLCITSAYLLAYHKHPFYAFYNDWLVIVGVAIAFAFYAGQKSAQLSLPAIAALPCMLALLIALQTALGMLGAASDAILPIAYFLMAALAMVLGATLAAGAQGAVRLTNALALAHLVAGLLSVVIASMQFVGAESLLGSWLAMQLDHDVGTAIRPYANTGQANQLALLFCMSIAAAWWLYQAGRLRVGIALVMVLSLVWGLALTQSRIGWLIMPIFAFFIWFWRGNADFKRVSGIALVGMLLLYCVLVATLPMIAALLGALTDSVAKRVGSGSERWVLIQQAWQISLAHPWFGAGWYEFGPQQVKIGADFAATVFAQHAHNIVLNFAAELGWPITLLIFGALAWWFVAACLRRPVSKEAGFATLFLLAVLVHSLVEFPLWYAYVLLPVALLMGMMHQQQFGAQQFGVPRMLVITVSVLLGLGLAGVATDYRRLVIGFRALGSTNPGLKAYAGATDKPAFTMFPQFYDYFRFARTPARPNMSADEIAFMESVASRFGYAPVMMRMSLVYALNARPEDAVRLMKATSRLHRKGYERGYQLWKNMANREPEKYAAVFKRLAVPDPAFVDPVRNP